MFGFFKLIFAPIIMPLVELILIPKIRNKVIRTETDRKRFDLIAGIAQEAAEEAVLHYPDTELDDLIKKVIDTTAGAFPTSSLLVVTRACGAAVRRAYHEYHASAGR